MKAVDNSTLARWWSLDAAQCLGAVADYAKLHDPGSSAVCGCFWDGSKCNNPYRPSIASVQWWKTDGW